MNNIKESFYNIVNIKHPEIEKLSIKRKQALIDIIFKAITGTIIPHKKHLKKFALTNTYINDVYGCSKAFHNLNKKTNIFVFSDDWDSGKHIAKTVHLKQKFHEWLWFQLKQHTETPDYLRDAKGRRILTPPNAIISKDKRGNTRKTRTRLNSSMVPICRDSIKKLLHYLNEEERNLLNGRSTGVSRIKHKSINEQLAWVRRASYQSLGILFSSSLKDPLPDSHLLQQYRECDSGRLLGLGFHLQNLIREVKNTALNGNWDHDIISCHFKLIYEIAKKHGYVAGAIKEYINNKSEFHQHLLDSYGIEKEDSKICMLSLIYGAPLTTFEEASIYKVLENKGDNFIHNELVISIKRDIAKSTKLLIDDGKISNGKIQNAVGKWMSIKKQNKSIASHILQGYEVLALHTAIEQLKGNILLLCHDGFVTKSNIDTTGVVELFYEKTGLEIEFKSESLLATYPE